MVSRGMNFSLSYHLVDRIKTRDHLRSEMGWEEVGNLETHEFFHTIIRENILKPIYRENSKNISAEEHIAIGQIRQCFLTLPLTELQIALWRDFVSFFCFVCFLHVLFFKELVPLDSEEAENEVTKLKVCLIHISIFMRVAKGRGASSSCFMHKFLEKFKFMIFNGDNFKSIFLCTSFREIFRFSYERNNSHVVCISGGKSHLMLVHNFMNYALLSVKFMSQINLVT